MSEQTQNVQNKWLLLSAVLLGGVAVFVYNMHIRAVRSQYVGNYIQVVEVTRDLDAGDRIKENNITPREIPAAEAKKMSFGNVIPWNQRDYLLSRGGQRINQSISKGNFLLWDHVSGRSGSSPSEKLTEGMVLKAIELDSNQSLGDALSAGDRVNLCGLFPEGNELKSYRIIPAVRVVNIGGKGAGESAGKVSGSYRRITIEVPEDVSLQLDNVLTHMVGQVSLELRPYSAQLPLDAEKINPELKRFAASAKAPTR